MKTRINRSENTEFANSLKGIVDRSVETKVANRLVRVLLMEINDYRVLSNVC